MAGAARRVLPGAGRVLPGAARGLPEDERRLIEMTSVSRVNDLRRGIARPAQRRGRALHQRSAWKATLFERRRCRIGPRGRPVVKSGVGGQVQLRRHGARLGGARSILLLRATRESGGRAESNIVLQLRPRNHPRHLRDGVSRSTASPICGAAPKRRGGGGGSRSPTVAFRAGWRSAPRLRASCRATGACRRLRSATPRSG